MIGARARPPEGGPLVRGTVGVMTGTEDRQAGARYMARLAELRAAGAISAEAELELIRHHHATRAAIASSMSRLLPEYARRTATDGQERALVWLSHEAREVGRREGRAARRVLEELGLPVDLLRESLGA